MTEKSTPHDTKPRPLLEARRLLGEASRRWPDEDDLRAAKVLTGDYPKPRDGLPDTEYMTRTMLAYVQQADKAITRALAATSQADAHRAIAEADQALAEALKQHPERPRMVR